MDRKLSNSRSNNTVAVAAAADPSSNLDHSAGAAHAQSVDAGRRHVLKATGVVVAGGAAALASGSASAAARLFESHDAAAGNVTVSDAAFDKPLDEFIVEVQHRWESNDIALVIGNRGTDAATITHMTPARIDLARGTLDLSGVLADGPVTLAAGEEIIVPLQRHPRSRRVGEDNISVLANVGHFDRTLQRDLKQRMSIVTDGNALAAITVAPGPRIA